MSEAFNEWHDKTKKKPLTPWEAWPAGAIEEIGRVLELNDAHPGMKITKKQMAQRLRDEHEVQVTLHTLGRYVREVLGRIAWGSP